MTIYNSDLHPEFAENLARVPKEGDLTLVIRHSTRGPIVSDGRGDEVGLTDEGIELCERLGGLLSYRTLGTIYSSTVPRCVETASVLSRGATQTVPILQRPQLARPEPVGGVEDLGLRQEIVDDPVRLVNHLLRVHRESDSHELPPTVAEILRCVLDVDSPEGSLRPMSGAGLLRLIVTHDDVIAFTLAFLLDRDEITADDLPWMLEGFFLWNEKGRTMLLWRGQRRPIPSEAFSPACTRFVSSTHV